MFDFSYGQGTYHEGDHHLEGKIVLGEHKLYLKGEKGDLATTYIPLEKITRLKLNGNKLTAFVRPSLSYNYVVTLQGEKKLITDLTNEIILRRGLRKKFLVKEWFEVE